ncbi:MAG TPA: acetyltransferase [Burkholderiales bacterium]|nr:acetyltransferase [Burkholderiales bacterium]
MTKSYDIFNGDADGLCALHQLRLETPCAAELVTGVKRDIRLLDRIDARAGDTLTVLDVSMKRNAAALKRALESGARVRYFDHHAPGEIPQHPALEAHVDTAPDICTSLIVDRYLGGRHRMWAVVAAFGDNLVQSAIAAAQPLHLDLTERARLHELGECLNYNAYGETVDDLHYHPADLYRTLERYRDPRHFIFDEPVFNVLRSAYAEDLYRANEIDPCTQGDQLAVFILPDAAWSRRINGLFGNRLAQAHPKRAHAVLVTKAKGYSVSVRAPLERPHGAGALCERFATGGGREGAGGIDDLPDSELERLIGCLREAFSAP